MKIGNKYFIRTVTYHLVGKVESIEGGFATLSGASWVADLGRFGDGIAKGTIAESEYVGDALVNLAAITDAFPWEHDLPTASI